MGGDVPKRVEEGMYRVKREGYPEPEKHIGFGWWIVSVAYRRTICWQLISYHQA